MTEQAEVPMPAAGTLQAAIALNEDQRKAIMHSPEDALLVVAGPGSGKTRVIVERVKYLVNNYGIVPSKILCLTFSEKAADEMRRRIEKDANTTEVETSTYHSFCLHILGESVLDTGVSFRSGLISKANQLVWGLKNIDRFGLEHIEIGNNAVRVIEALIEGISAFRDEIVGPQKLKEYIDKKRKEYQAELLLLQQASHQAEQQAGKGKKRSRVRKSNDAHEEEQLQDRIAFINKLSDLQKVYAQYEEYKRQESLIDYDDMIHIVLDTFRRKPEVLRRYQEKYDYLLVDEFQDNNYAQLELVKQLCPDGNITAVGDDDQSIYRFRGAYLTIFEDFKLHYKDNLAVVKLERNYRSTKNIVGLAKKLLDPVPNREQKNLYSENEDGDRPVVARCSTDLAEIEYVVNKIKSELVGREFTRRDGTVSKIGYRDIAILSRKRLEGMKFAKALKAHGLPCTFVGESKIFTMPIVRDLLAYLRVAADPLDNGIELARILLAHGVPEQDVKVINHAAKSKARELVKRLDREIKSDGSSSSSSIGSRADDTDNNRNYGTDFVYDVIEEIAGSDSSSSTMLSSGKALPILDQLRSRSLVSDVYKQLRTIINRRDKETVGQFVYDVLMKHTDIYKRTLQDADFNESARDRLVLHEFLDIVQEFESVTKNGTVRDLLAHIDMMSGFDIELSQGKEDADAIFVSTIHRSKGLEFPVVFVVDVADRRLPILFREKQFYCPSELAHGFRNRDKSEKDISIEEERRLLYVAMTRAKHLLFLTLAELYGNNTTKTKPSQFLIELDVENNPLVNLVEYDASSSAAEAKAQPLAVAESRIEQVKQEYQLLAAKFVSQMQLKSAFEKIVDLAMLEHIRTAKSLDGFTVEEFTVAATSITARRAEVEEALREERPPLIDRDKIHFSASALKTYQDCPLKYKFQYVLGVPSGPKAYFDLGTAVHSTVEVLTKRQIGEPGYLPTKEEAIKILDSYWVSSSYKNLTKEREDRESAEKMLEFFCNWCAEREQDAFLSKQKRDLK